MPLGFDLGPIDRAEADRILRRHGYRQVGETLAFTPLLREAHGQLLEAHQRSSVKGVDEFTIVIEQQRMMS